MIASTREIDTARSHVSGLFSQDPHNRNVEQQNKAYTTINGMKASC